MNECPSEGNNMFEKLKIRVADPNDYEGIIAIFKSWGSESWDTKFAERYYRDFFGNRHCYQMDEVLVGMVNGRIVGVTGYCPDIHETDDIHWLNWLYVHRDFQKHGYGGLLLDHVINILKAKKARKLYVDPLRSCSYQGVDMLSKRYG